MANRRQQEGLVEIPCRTCGKEFLPYRSWVVTCSKRCRLASPRDDLPTTPVEFVCCDCGATSTGYTRNGGGGQFKYCDGCKPAALERARIQKNVARRIATAGNPAALREKNRRDNLRRSYGITPDEYDAMLEKQNGVCLLCAEPPKPDGVRAASRLHVDHDHETGKVRALLCNHCNRGIGAFRDDPELMQRASLYVWQHRVT